MKRRLGTALLLVLLVLTVVALTRIDDTSTQAIINKAGSVSNAAQ